MKGLVQRSAQRGFNLVECLIALGLGLVIIACATTFYLVSGNTYKTTHALAQMTEDAAIGLSILRTQVALAGYSNPQGLSLDGSLERPALTTPLFGCTGGITSASMAQPQLADVVCVDDDQAPDALVVRYEADTRNTVPTSAGTPTDCLGNSTPPFNATAYLADNRYFIYQNTLSCRGNGHTVSQPLLDNVVNLQIRYGISEAGDSHVSRYVSALDLSAGSSPAAHAPLWRQVRAVQLCLLLRSEFDVLDEPAQYRDCDGSAHIAPDKRLYRAFNTTVHLPNPL